MGLEKEKVEKENKSYDGTAAEDRNKARKIGGIERRKKENKNWSLSNGQCTAGIVKKI